MYGLTFLSHPVYNRLCINDEGAVSR